MTTFIVHNLYQVHYQMFHLEMLKMGQIILTNSSLCLIFDHFKLDLSDSVL